MNFREINFFKEISDSSLQQLNKNHKLLSYRIGQPLSNKNVLSKNILLIIDGKARLIGQDNDSIKTIAKLGNGSWIGLGSLLRLKGCEEVLASEELKVISFPEEIIIDLYKKEKTFQTYCDSIIFPCEILGITETLINQSSRTDIKLITAFNILSKFAKLKSLNKDFNLTSEKSVINILASANIKNRSIGEILEDNCIIKSEHPFHTRIIEIPKNIYNEFNKLSNQTISIPKAEDNNITSSINIEKASDILEPSNSGIDRIEKKKIVELIKGQGNIRETLACLQMISNYMDLPFRKDSIEKILREELRRGKKPSMELCGALMSMLGVQVSRGKIAAKLASRIPTPCLIPWNEGFAFVQESSNNGLLIASPSEGWLNVTIQQLEEKFKEGLDIMMVERNNSTPNKKFGLQWFLPSLKKHKSSLFQVLLASFVVQLFGLANPLLIQVIIDKVISQRSLDTLQILGIALVVVTILGGVIGGLRTFLFTETTNRIDTRLGSEVIDHLLKLPLNYFDKRPVGELGTRVAELERIRNFLTGQALTTILDAAFSVIYIIFMLIYSWLLTAIALIVVPIQIILTLLGSPLLRRQIRASAHQNAKTQSHLVEVLTGIQTVKAQNVETVSRWKWQDLYGKYISRTFEKTITGTLLGETSKVLQQLSQLFVLWIGATLVLKGQLTLGQLIAFRIISGYVTQPLLRLSSIWENVQELKVSFERLADIIDTPEESQESDKANIPLPSIKGEVRFENVTFSFRNPSENILNNINLKINQGEFIGIAGQSGSGKSTLMKLLPRLYEIEQGRILIDGFDINKVELYSLRRQIGIVPQDPLLFAGSVSENIALTDPDISADDIIEAAKVADAHDFIMELPLGYSTNVGERGSSLSGGQKQRLAIARTIISKPRLIIMDEATSALDYETESNVCENLREKCKGITVFFITHRLGTIKNADKVIMMHKGNISEIGKHDELIEKKGRYYALYKQQESN